MLAAALASAATLGLTLGFGCPAAGRASAAVTPRVLARPARAHEPTRSPDLIQPTTLATLPNGALLILDSSRDQILELTSGGRLSVFAGSGRLGFSGDGGPARRAELHFTYFSSAELAVARNGSVDVLDNGNCRVRTISPNGIIRTLLHVPLVKVYPSGRACPLTGIAVSRSGSLYVSTSSDVKRLSKRGHLIWVAGSHGTVVHEPTRLTPSNVVFAPDSLAFDRAGKLDIASFSPRAIYQLSASGRLVDLGASYVTQLTPDPDGEVLAGTHAGVIQKVTSSGVRRFYDVVATRIAGLDWGRIGAFQEDGIAVTRSGTIYVDNAEGNGYGEGTVLVRVSPSRRAALVPIHTPLAATLPRVGAPGFPASLYPPARASHGPALRACPAKHGLERFTPRTVARASRIARGYLSSQFASDITRTDRSWWTGAFNAYTSGRVGGRHTVTSEAPASRSRLAAEIDRACGRQLVADSITVTVGRSAYSDFTGTLYLLDRDGHPLVYDVS